MKITVVTGFFLPVPAVLGGSTERSWWRLSQELARQGHEVRLISRLWPGWPTEETRGGVQLRRLRGADHSRRLWRNLLHDLAWGWRVARALPPGDVVICNTVTLPIWLRRLKPAAGRVVAVVARMPKGHGRAYGRVDRLFALSTAVAEALCAEAPALRPRIAIVPYPIDWALQAAQSGRRRPGPLTIGYVGRIHPEKGIELLLAAAARLAPRRDLPAWRLELTGPAAVPAGGGGEAWRDGLQARFGPRLEGRLRFAEPEFDEEKLARRYGAIDIFCYPSLAAQGETFGVAVAEAMAAGCAPVVSALDCFRDLVQPEETGIVFDHTAADAETRLAEALARLLRDASLRAAIAGRAQAQAQRFDYATVTKIVLGELETLLRSPP